jgi:probable rRNA maturation factor
MAKSKIHFFTEDIAFTLKQKSQVRTWLAHAIKEEKHTLRELNFIFCSDDYLLSINRQYLNHDTYTDIITFDHSEEEEEDISGDLFISIERVKENALKYEVSDRDEVHRVMIHGTLHLLGYTDKGKKAKSLMTEKENYYLHKRAF